MKQVALSARINFSFALIFILVAGIMTSIHWRVDSLREQSAHLERQVLPVLLQTGQLSQELFSAFQPVINIPPGEEEARYAKLIELLPQLTERARQLQAGFTIKSSPLRGELASLVSTLGAIGNKLQNLSPAAKEQLPPLLAQVSNDLNQVSTTSGQLAQDFIVRESAERAKLTTTMVVGLAVLFVLLVGMMLAARLAMRPLKMAVDQLDSGADNVAQTAKRLANSQQRLTKGVSENTSAVLEAIDSLEKMLNLAKRNANHSTEAKNLMLQAKEHVQKANLAMHEIAKAMEEILAAGKASSQIIKTVEEIAFQTNILALNAAVEAARAGEAGVGFAVVADEVRNLASNSAQAAQNTAKIIAGIGDCIQRGDVLVQNAEESVSSMVAASDQMGGLVGEIAEASQQQAQDIQNIHQSIASVDKVTQENAADAGETQAIAQGLINQASILRSTLAKAAIILRGPQDMVARRAPKKIDGQNLRPSSEALPMGSSPVFATEAKPSSLRSSDRAKTKQLDAAIPMDDDW